MAIIEEEFKKNLRVANSNSMQCCTRTQMALQRYVNDSIWFNAHVYAV